MTYAVAWKRDGKVWIIVKEHDDDKIVAMAGGIEEGNVKTKKNFTYSKAEGWDWKIFSDKIECNAFYFNKSIEK